MLLILGSFNCFNNKYKKNEIVIKGAKPSEDVTYQDLIKQALFDFHNNLSLNFANKTIETVGINLPQVLIDKKEKAHSLLFFVLAISII